MKNLFNKELKLAIVPGTLLFSLLSGLLLIPNYPYIVGIFYFFLAIQINFTIGRANKDIEFMLTLPITREDIVKTKCFSVLFPELLQIVVAIPFAIISSFIINTSGNSVGMSANFAFFGMILISMSVFNLIYLPSFFKSGYKLGVPLILAIIGFGLTELCLELVVNFIPILKDNLNSLDSSSFLYQGILLIIGIIFFILSTLITYRLSIKTFKKVSM